MSEPTSEVREWLTAYFGKRKAASIQELMVARFAATLQGRSDVVEYIYGVLPKTILTEGAR